MAKQLQLYLRDEKGVRALGHSGNTRPGTQNRGLEKQNITGNAVMIRKP
jgi:hypothetical protein